MPSIIIFSFLLLYKVYGCKDTKNYAENGKNENKNAQYGQKEQEKALPSI
jgi:hypothetical protein